MLAGRPKLSYANVVATLALVLALTSPAWGAPAANGAASLTQNVKKALGLSKKADKNAKRALSRANLALARGGPQGPAGAQGLQGSKGDQGLPGAGGSPDTPAQVLSKLIQVDGSGSGLDADLLDGLGPSAFLSSGATAGGDVTGAFSNLQIAAGAVGAPEVVNATNAAGLRRADLGIGGGLFNVDFPSQAAQTCSLRTVMGITGAQNQDLVIANPRSSPGLMAIPLDGSNPDEVDFFVCNPTAGAIDPPSISWRIFLLR
jgi:hypothetical protein